MRNFTLSCGHTYNREALVIRAISCDLNDNVCPHCLIPFSDEEGFYLEYSAPNQTMDEFKKQCLEAKERDKLRLLNQPVRKFLPECSMICKSGKKCTKVSTIKSGKFCNLHQ